MISTTYISQASESFSDEDLLKVLAQCRRNNAANGITGMLLFGNTTFAQCLEGEEASVDELLVKISADPRHTWIKVLRRTPIATRNFSEWTMGFEQVTKGALSEVPGLSNFGLGDFNPDYLESNPEVVETLLRWGRRA